MRNFFKGLIYRDLQENDKKSQRAVLCDFPKISYIDLKKKIYAPVCKHITLEILL